MASGNKDAPMKTMASSAGQGKRLLEEEKKNMIDARELVARFRSKKDLYDYLLLQSKIKSYFHH
jgi:hypothetical protein